MKTLQQHILERLKINKDFESAYTEHPKNREQLYKIIEERLEENSEDPYLLDIDTSEITSMKNLFENCLAKRLNLSSWDVSNVENMGGMFVDCTKLEYIDLTDWKTKSLNSILSMFYNCHNLKEIKGIDDFDISTLIRQKNKDGNGFGYDAFYNVKHEIIPQWWYAHCGY